jgi:hypothetical protein
MTEWREACLVVASEPASLVNRAVFVRGHGDALITQYHKAGKASNWPDTFTLLLHEGNVEEKVVLWDGSNGGAWFRFIALADMGNTKRASPKSLSSSNDAPQGTLVFTVHEASGEEFAQDSFFSIVQVCTISQTLACSH